MIIDSFELKEKRALIRIREFCIRHNWNVYVATSGGIDYT